MNYRTRQDMRKAIDEAEARGLAAQATRELAIAQRSLADGRKETAALIQASARRKLARAYRLRGLPVPRDLARSAGRARREVSAPAGSITTR